MAATDKHYRDQNTLDIVFALSSLAMLVGMALMLIQDYNREYKREQRFFRDVEVAMALRAGLNKLPEALEIKEAAEAVEVAERRRDVKNVDGEMDELRKSLTALEERLAAKAQDLAKADAKAKGEIQKEIQEAESESQYKRAQLEYLAGWKSKVLEKVEAAKSRVAALYPERDLKEQAFQTVKSDLESRVSFYDIEVDHHGPGTPLAKRYKGEIETLSSKLAEAKAARDAVLNELRENQSVLEAYEEPLGRATTRLKKLNDQFDAAVRSAAKLQWGVGDWVRAWPILDAFASPFKIHEFVINDVPIDYNFKHVTRFDRCATCHLGIAREEYSRESLLSLRGVTNEQDRKLTLAKQILRDRQEALKGLPEAKAVPDPDLLKLSTLAEKDLTDARVTQFCAHPRLDLFVGPTSKHPAEKFGCTSCHAGQPSSTSFVLASHAPNTSAQERDWKDKYSWESNHYWDFPMLPKRFLESSCLKCHYEVTDLVSSENRVEAPRLLEGYNIIKDVGCYGCHEIHGRKGGRQVGPDLRLEAYPPLEDLSPGQRARVLSDPDTAPGNLRKVGPSLFRLAEKTNDDFVRKWIFAPRGFRPDTKMPHYYGLSTNDKSVLPDNQKDFPETEVYAITHYLFSASSGYLKEIEARHKDSPAAREADAAYQHFLNEFLDSRASMTEARLKALVALASRLEWSRLLETPAASGKKFADEVADKLVYYGGKLPADENKEITKRLDEELREVDRRMHLRRLPAQLPELPAGLKGDDRRGRQLFIEKGCLACHVHDATQQAQGSPGDKDYSPAFAYDAEFGPNLSQIVEKLGTKAGDRDSARRWLHQWLKDPTVHSPRTKMPSVHLSDQEALDIGAWLLSHPKGLDIGPDWEKLNLAKPGMKQLKDLARVYLTRILATTDMEKLLRGEALSPGQINELPAEERLLAASYGKAAGAGKDVDEQEKESLREKTLLEYLGKKAVGRLGCYGCHDIPGMENAKSIGVGLNDWGKKPSDRLAFEDIANFAKRHYHFVDSLTTEEGKAVPGGAKKPYERFFADLLFHKTREGYLNQKLLDPRSYDYNRLRPWDDRSRMPQFKFAKFRLPAQVKTDRRLAEALSAFAGRKGKVAVDDVNALLPHLPGEGAAGALKKALEDNGGKFLDDVGFDTTKAISQKLIDEHVGRAEEILAGVQKRLPGEMDLAGQANVQEAKAREAVMTFVLGLVAEPVPLQSINQPKGDRLAEVKGRQVLEKFNCNSCHLVRPGFFEFNAGDRDVKKYLESIHGLYLKSASTTHFFPEHSLWSGQDPTNGRVRAMVGWPTFADGKTTFPLLEALRFQGLDRTLHDIGSIQPLTVGDSFGVKPRDMVTPPPSAFASPASLESHLQTHGPFGGTFADALARYLMEKTQKDATPLNAQNARSSTPPWLTGQGEKTQPDWLYQFLLNPQAVRKMVVLRMPRFNLSEEDSRVLVEYFSAVDRLSNVGIGLTAPFEAIKQQDGLASDFWKEKNAQYVRRLKDTKVKDAEGKETKATWYEKRIEELTPVWTHVARDHDGRVQSAKARVAAAQSDFDALNKDYEPLAKQLKKLTDDLEAKIEEARKDKAKAKDLAAAIKDLQGQVKDLEVRVNTIKPAWEARSRVLEAWKTEHDALARDADRFKVEALKEEWTQSQAYLTDSFRLLFHKQLCSQCHQVGERETPASTPGPSLTMSHKRLRPGWMERWISNPAYFLHYTPMPINFKKGEANYQELFVGSSFDQIQAVRDVLMVYPQVSRLPVNEHWVLPPALDRAPPEKTK